MFNYKKYYEVVVILSNDELIKKYYESKFKIEMNIIREKYSLLKYQLNGDEDAINDCNLKLGGLYSDLKNIDNCIFKLKSSNKNSLDLPIPTNDLSNGEDSN